MLSHAQPFDLDTPLLENKYDSSEAVIVDVAINHAQEPEANGSNGTNLDYEPATESSVQSADVQETSGGDLFFEQELNVEAAPASNGPRFTWFMVPRVTQDATGRIFIPNTAQWADPPGGFPLEINATGSTVNDITPTQYTLEVFESGSSTPAQPAVNQTDPVFKINLPEGPHDVKITVTESGGTSAFVRETIDVKNYLIVTLGDSYGSGEGNPDWTRDEIEQDTTSRPEYGEWMASAASEPANTEAETQGIWHELSHRSSSAAGAQLALDLENNDPHSSVTFVFLAQTGASINEGILNEYEAVLEDLDRENLTARGIFPMPSQITQLNAIIGDRVIDALTLSVGGNDVGFANVLRGLLLADEGLAGAAIRNIGYEEFVNDVLGAADDGNWADVRDALNLDRVQQVINVGPNPLVGLNGLPAEYDRLARQLRTVDATPDSNLPHLLHAPRQTFIVEYPDPTTHFDNGQVVDCQEVMNDIEILGFNFLEIDAAEITRTRRDLIIRLNDILRDSANRNGWVPVDGITEAFAGHGYCEGLDNTRADNNRTPAPDRPVDGPLQNPEATRFIRRATEAARLQGPSNKRDTTGTMHPNRWGHQAIKDEMFRYIAPLTLEDGVNGQFASGTDPVQFVLDLEVGEVASIEIGGIGGFDPALMVYRPRLDGTRSFDIENIVDPAELTTHPEIVTSRRGDGFVLFAPDKPGQYVVAIQENPESIPSSGIFNLKVQVSPGGGSGDVIEIDLKQTLAASSFSSLRPSDTTIQHVGFGPIEIRSQADAVKLGTIFWSDQVSGQPFATTGKMYFVPETEGMQVSSLDLLPNDQGFQGKLSWTVTADGMDQQFTIQIGPGFSTIGDNAVTFGTGADDRLRQQQRLRFLGYPDLRTGQTGVIPVTGDINDGATLAAFSLYNAAVTDGTSTLVDNLEPGLINAANAPRWVSVARPADPAVMGYKFGGVGADTLGVNWMTSWAADILEEAGRRLVAAGGTTLEFMRGL